jgi:hypothetical protein
MDRAMQDCASAIEIFSDRARFTKTPNRLLDEHEFADQEKVPSEALKEFVRSIRELQDQLRRSRA